MARDPGILAACPTFALPTLERAVGGYVRVVPAASLDAAKSILETDRRIALIVCGVHFDESRMYDLLRYASYEFPRKPFICVRILDAEIPLVSREAIRIAAEALGASAYVDVPDLIRAVGPEAAETELRNAVLARLPGRQLLNGNSAA